MNKLQKFAIHALVTPAITFGAVSAMAQQTTDQKADRQQQSGQQGQGAMHASSNKNAVNQSDVRRAEDSQNPSMQLRQYIDSVPAYGMKASDLMGATVKTVRDEDIGNITDLILDKNGQIVAAVVGVGGFLGMGERDVAIGWGHIMRSFSPEKQELRIDVTEENLRYAPEFKK